MVLSILAIALGAGLGALLRWALSVWLNGVFPSLPPGTLLANLIGGYLIGIALVLFAHRADWPPQWRLFAVTGFLGGLTTFSTFSAEVMQLIQQGRAAAALGAVSAHVAGSLVATWAGIVTAERWLRV